MGFAALLANDTPGVDFRAGDLIKNLLLSVFLEKDISFQDELYRTLWSRRVQGLMTTDHFIGGACVCVKKYPAFIYFRIIS